MTSTTSSSSSSPSATTTTEKARTDKPGTGVDGLAEDAQIAISAATDRFLTEVYRRHLRSKDRRMHECAAKCYENTRDSKIRILGCVEQCSEDATSAKKTVRYYS